MAGINGKAAAAVGIGSLFVYAGLRRYSILKATQNIISGKKPSQDQQSSPIGSGSSQAPTSDSNAAAPIAAMGGDAGQAMSLAKLYANQYGWSTGQEWSALVQLWNRESGWRWNATNPSSGAYGIPQSLPANKMASAGADWKTNPATQIVWGLGYIKSTYGDPIAAWNHEQSQGWY